MSSDQSLDPYLIEQTKQQIRGLVQEIAQFSKSEMAPEEFYCELLPRVVSALAAIGGVVWTKNEEGRLALQYQVNLHQTRLAEKDEEEQMNHARLLHKVLVSGENLLVPPHSGAGDGEQGGNPTDYLLVLGALKTELETVGVLEIFQRPEPGPAVQKGYLRFVAQMCELASDFLNTRQLRHFSDRQALWTQLEEFTRLVHASLNPRETAYTIANEGRRLIECDRLSVAVRRGGRCVVEAISGQDLFDKRSNMVRLMNRLATVVVASGEPVWYTGDTRDMAPQVEDAVQEYVDETHTKMVAVLPLRRPEPAEKEPERPGELDESPPPVGALIVEQIEDSRVQPKTYQRVEVVCQHSASALANSLEHGSLFLLPVWQALGKTRLVTRARTLPKVLVGAGVVLAIVLGLALVPAEFAPRAKGTLEPLYKWNIFAGTSGTVTEVRIDHGQWITEDWVKNQEPLVVLRNYKLSEEIIQLERNLEQAKAAVASLAREVLTSAALSPEARLEKEGLLAEQIEKRDALQRQLNVLKEEEKQLRVTSPAPGRVITWDPKNRLISRPVDRGQTLLRIADTNGPWVVEIQMPDDRIGHILRAQNLLRQKVRARLAEVLREVLCEPVRQRLEAQCAAAPAESSEPVDQQSGQEADQQFEARLEAALDEAVAAELARIPDDQLSQRLYDLSGQTIWMPDQLEVSFIVAGNPGTTYYGRIREIEWSAEPRSDEGNTTLIRVDFDKDSLPPEQLQQGTTVTAKVACGRRALGYVLFHDLAAWARKMWFRWF